MRTRLVDICSTAKEVVEDLISIERWQKYFYATLQTQLQFTSLLHQFTDKHHKFPFQNGSLFFHHNPHSSRLSSLTPVIVVSLLTFHIWSEQDTCVSSNTWRTALRTKFGTIPLSLCYTVFFPVFKFMALQWKKKLRIVRFLDVSKNSFEAFLFFRVQSSEEALKVWDLLGR